MLVDNFQSKMLWWWRWWEGWEGEGFNLALQPLIALFTRVDMGVLAANIGYFSPGFVAKSPHF